MLTKTISYSQYKIFYECPWRYKLEYIDSLREYIPSSEALFGRVMHEAVETYLVKLYEETIAKANAFDVNGFFYEAFKEELMVDKRKTGKLIMNKQAFIEMANQGFAILDEFKRQQPKFFPKRNWELVGTEKRLEIPIHGFNHVNFLGYYDVILRNVKTGRYRIIDLKTSNWGWSDWRKKNPITNAQLLLYKKFLACIERVPASMIDVEFLILKRNLYKGTPYKLSRLQKFIPAHGSVSMGKIDRNLKTFIIEVIREDGTYHSGTNFSKTADTNNCRYCPFKESPKLCNRESLPEDVGI